MIPKAWPGDRLAPRPGPRYAVAGSIIHGNSAAGGAEAREGGDVQHLYSRISGDPFQVVCARLEKALAERRYAVLSLLDLKPKLLSKGVVLPHSSRLYEVCQAQASRPLLEAWPALALLLPWRIAVFEEPGAGVQICTASPARVWALFEHPEILPCAETLDRDLQAILEVAAG